MASEPNIVEIYVDRVTRQVLEYIPAAGTLSNGEDLPAAAFFITQINLDTFDDSTPIMVCPHKCKHEDCEGGCHMAEFTPVDDIGDEEEIG